MSKKNSNGAEQFEDLDKKISNVDELVSQIEGLYAKHAFAAHHFGEQLEAILRKFPDRAIPLISEFYERGLDDVYRDPDGTSRKGYVQAIAGGPKEDIPWAVYNAVGAVYPGLTREQKDGCLKQLIYNILDGRNYLEVNSVHTRGIREPLLLADITVVRWLYWPGLGEGKRILENYKKFPKLKRGLMNKNGLFKPHKVNSDFLVAYSLLRSDMSKFGEKYIEVADKDFLDRVVRAIVALRFGGEIKEGEIEKGSKRLKELLPKSLHNRIEPLRLEANWVDHTKFR